MVLTHSSAYSWLDTKSVQVEVPSFRFLFFFCLISYFNLIFFCLSVECLCCVYICVWFLKDFIRKKNQQKKRKKTNSNSYFCLAVGYEVWLWAQVVLAPGGQRVT